MEGLIFGSLRYMTWKDNRHLTVFLFLTRKAILKNTKTKEKC